VAANCLTRVPSRERTFFRHINMEKAQHKYVYIYPKQHHWKDPIGYYYDLSPNLDAYVEWTEQVPDVESGATGRTRDAWHYDNMAPHFGSLVLDAIRLGSI